MPPPQSQLDWILTEARKRPPSERAAFLDGACAGDLSLRERIEASLRMHPNRDTTTPADCLPTVKAGPALEDETVGEVLGPYKILQKIGEGGCGAVYMAEQERPVRRKVALKVIKLGMDTKAVIARFEAERQALALMDHPNIAKVLDAGATETGRPYFVMELVRGIKITNYCDQNHLGIRQRLELFIQVCQAIQHAHQKGIIHRDIKPSNILVTLHDGLPVPKVIDFGIAKATTDQRLTDKTLFTAYEQFIGTPAYMSPEQAEMSGLDIDTRSDIYSLGVLLYELLTGRTPFDPKELMDSGLEAMRKTIREQDPVRPSTKLHTLAGDELTATAKSHGVEVSRLAMQLRGDLDWIVMKCLEKDRTRRYETATGLGMDVKRHLGNEVVMARPPSKLYEFQKTFRRHKFGFIATGSVMLALAVGVALASWQAMVAMRAKGQEAIQRQKAQTNELRAIEASAQEAGLRKQAQAQELAARRRAYASDMNFAAQALQGNNWGRAVDLLNRQRPGSGQVDLRGWEWRYLWQQVRSDELFKLCRLSSEVNSLSVSPNGSLLAIGARHRGGVSVWDLNTRRELVRVAEADSYNRAVFSPTEPLLAFSSSPPAQSTPGPNDKLRIWNTTTRQIVGEFSLKGTCLGVAFALDGRTVATCTVFRSGGGVTGTGGSIDLWRVPDGTRLASFSAQPAGIDPGTPFACAPDMSLAAYGSDDGRLHVIDLHSGKELWGAVASKEYVTTVAFSPDGKTLASAAGFRESDVRLWRVATGEPIGRLTGHDAWVGSIVFWPDGKRVATSSADQTLRIWDVATQQCVDLLRGHRQEVWRLALLPDGKTLTSGSKDGMVCVWDTSVSHPHRTHMTLPEPVASWGITPGSQSIVAVNLEGQVSEWKGPEFQEKTPLFAINRPLPDRQRELFSEDGRSLAAASTNGTLQVWDLQQRELRRQWAGGGEVRPEAFLAGGTKLLTSSMSHGLHQEWDLASGRALQSWEWATSFVTFNLSPDERDCLSVGYDGDFVLRTLATKTDRKLPLDCLEATTGGFSPDGSLFAIASDLGFARVWNTSTWQEVATLGGVLMGMNSARFSADGKRVVIASSGAEAVKLFDTESWEEVFTLAGIGFGSKGARFSPDGNHITWGNRTGDLYIWRAPSWDEIRAAELNNSQAPR